MNTTVFLAVWATIFLLWTAFATRGMWMNAFNLVDKRSFVESAESYQRLNRMMVDGDVSLYSHSYAGEKTFSLSVEYKGEGERESVTNRFHGTDINTVIDDAYNWSIQRGFITE